MKLTNELKDLALTQVQYAKSQAEGPHQEYNEKCRKSYLYEACKLPGKIISNERIPKGIQPYVEPVLRECKKEAKPQLLDSFTSDQRIAMAFRSRGWNAHSAIDDILTFNLNKIFLDEQDGYAVIEKAIDEALGPGSAFIKVYVSEDTDRDVATSEDWIDMVEFMPLLADGWEIDAPAAFATDKKGNYKGFEWKTITNKGEDTNALESTPATISRLIRGTIPLIKVDRKIKAEFIESKDLWFSTSFGADFDKCRYIGHRILTTVGEAEKRGFDPEKLERAAADDKDIILQELSLTGITDINQDYFSIDEKEKLVFIWEHYIYSSQFSKKKTTKLYQVIATDNEVLEINEIPFMPFVHAKKKNVNGQFYAQGFYDEAKPYQDALTKKYRQADQIATVAAWPRYIAVGGAYNKQSVLNSHQPGAVIEVNEVGALAPFPHQTLDQSFDKHYQLLRESEQQSLRRGFGSANLAEMPQLATAVIASAVYHDAQRGMELSKSFRATLLRPLYTLIYETMRSENWTLEDENGQKIDNFTYPSRYEINIDIATEGDDTAQIMRLGDAITTAATLSQIGGKWLSDSNKYEMIKFILTRADLPADKFVSDPATQADPLAEEMQRQNEALNHIAGKVQLQNLILDGWGKAAAIHKTEQEAQEVILNGASKREVDHQESLTRIQQIMNDAKAKADKTAVENKRVNYDAILGAQERRHDNAVNGIM
ncbi:hypothetical protein K4M64_004544 [Salmonella enterica]|nr:hypothetical protein [Salmonella enterica]